VQINFAFYCMAGVCFATTIAAAGVADRSGTDTLDEVRRLYFEAHDGSKAAASRCSNLLEELRREHPANPLVLAYSGSLTLRESAATLALWRKGKLARQGLELLDLAVKLAPENLEVRFIRSASTFHLPRLFKREAETQADFAWLASRVEEAAEQGTLQRRFAAAALYYHGLLLERQSEPERSKEAWEAALRVGPGTNGAAQAAKKLQ
jgi:hypothetical protein